MAYWFSGKNKNGDWSEPESASTSEEARKKGRKIGGRRGHSWVKDRGDDNDETGDTKEGFLEKLKRKR